MNDNNKKSLPVRIAVTVIYVIGILMTVYLCIKCFLLLVITLDNVFDWL